MAYKQSWYFTSNLGIGRYAPRYQLKRNSRLNQLEIRDLVVGRNFYVFIGNIKNQIHTCGGDPILCTQKDYHKILAVNYFSKNNIIINKITTSCQSAGNRGKIIFFITNYGELYAIGDNNNDQLGIASKKSQFPKEIALIDYFSKKSIKVIDAVPARNYCIVLDANGVVYVCGKDDYLNFSTSNWMKLSGLKKQRIVKIKCGYLTAYFLDENNVVWSGGWNKYNQLGRYYGIGYAMHPIEFFKKKGIKIVDIEPGVHHCIAIDNNHNIYGWGGQGSCTNYMRWEENGFSAIASEGPIYILKTSKILNYGEKITQIKSGDYHAGFVTNKHRFFLWGKNRSIECLTDAKSDSCLIHCINEFVINKTKCDGIVNMWLGDGTCLLLSGTWYLDTNDDGKEEKEDVSSNKLNQTLVKVEREKNNLQQLVNKMEREMKELKQKNKLLRNERQKNEMMEQIQDDMKLKPNQYSIEEWLTNIVRLPEYMSNFVDAGFDMEVLNDNDITKEDLKEIGIKKLGHIKKLLKAITNIK